MKVLTRILPTLTLSPCRATPHPLAAQASVKPNHIIMLADDLGYGDLGRPGLGIRMQ